MTLKEICGLYRHYKGDIYDVLGVGEETETSQTYVIYQKFGNNLGEEKIWLRPIEMFFSDVKIRDNFIPRFEKMSEEEENEVRTNSSNY